MDPQMLAIYLLLLSNVMLGWSVITLQGRLHG